MVRIKPEVDYLMKKYEELVEKKGDSIKESLRRNTKALHYEEIDRISIIQTTQTALYPRHEIFYLPEKNLIAQLANVVLTLSHKTDYVPYLDPFEGVTIMAEAFGCLVEVPPNGDPWVKKPIIRNPSEVYEVKKPDKNNKVFEKVIRTLNFFEKQTGYRIPVGATDPQSPLNVASLMWDNQSFLTACVVSKKEVHHVLNIITDSFIEFYTMQYEALKNPAFPVHSFPLVNSSDGISISDDEAILLSPELFEEFGVPYLNRISDAFGGLYYHSCGDFGHILDKILTIKNLRAINAHLSPREFKPEYIHKVLEKGIGLFLGISDREIGWDSSNIWPPDEVFNIYDNYYIPNVIKESLGKGVVLVGYGGYAGYFDTIENFKGNGNILVDSGGHTITKGPLVNVPIEIKNKNFDHIIDLIFKMMDTIDK